MSERARHPRDGPRGDKSSFLRFSRPRPQIHEGFRLRVARPLLRRTARGNSFFISPLPRIIWSRNDLHFGRRKKKNKKKNPHSDKLCGFVRIPRSVSNVRSGGFAGVRAPLHPCDCSSTDVSLIFRWRVFLRRVPTKSRRVKFYTFSAIVAARMIFRT